LVKFVVTKPIGTHLGCQLLPLESRVPHPCTSPISYHNLKPGKYTFRVFDYPNGTCNGGVCHTSRTTTFSWTVK
jgi:hypothetical protein